MQQSITEEMRALYRKVDARVAALAAVHAGRLRCGRGCAVCCVDELTVYEVETVAVRKHYAHLLKKELPHPPGACAFLDDSGSCRIYPVRPYVCRTQGLPLHWTEETGDGMVAYRDICPENGQEPPVETLPEDQCWCIGPVEEQLAHLQFSFGDGALRRVALRELFVDQRSGGGADLV